MTTAIVDPTPIGADGKASGALDAAGEIDRYQISLAPGHTYSIAMNGSPSGEGTLADPFVYLYDSTGRLLASDDDSGAGANSLITYTPPGALGDPAATYEIAARSYHDAGTGTYQIIVNATEISDDWGNGLDTLGTVAAGHSVAGTLEVAGDTDWFKVMLTAGTTYSISLAGASSSTGTLPDPYVYLYDASGQVVGTDDDSGTGAESLLAFTAPGVAGTEAAYFIAAASYAGRGSGTYQLSVSSAAVVPDDYASSVNVDEFPDGFAGAPAIVVGQSINGRINTIGDSDWLKVSLTAGTSYEIAMNGITGSAGARTLADPAVALYDSTGLHQVAADDDGGTGPNALLVYTPAATGTFYISANAYQALGAGSYQLSVIAGSVSIPSEPFKLGTSGTTYGDVEGPVSAPQCRFTLEAHVTYSFQADRFGGSTLDPHLVLTDTQGQLLASDTGAAGGSSAVLVYTPDVTDTYYLETSPYTSGATGTYSLTVSAADGGGTAGTFPGVGSVELGLPVNGIVSGTAHGALEVAGDADWFAVALTAGTAYSIALKGSSSGSGTLADPYVYLYDHLGQPLVFDDDNGAGSDSLLSYTPNSTDTYYVGARSYHDGGTGTYQVSVMGAAGAVDDYADTLADTNSPMGAINPGQSVISTGTLETIGDRDWFQVSMTAGSAYSISLNGTANGAGTLPDPFVYLYDASGHQLASDDDSGPGASSLLTYAPQATGTYYIAAASYNDQGSGTYQIQVATAAAQTDDWGADKDHHGTIATLGATVGSTKTVSGNLEHVADADWFAVTLTANTAYSFALDGSAGGVGTLSDPYVYLYNSLGDTVLASNDDGGPGSDSLLDYTATATGTYFVAARAYHDAGTGTYQLEVTLTGLPPAASP